MTYLWNLVYLVVGVLAVPFFLWQRLVKGKRRGGWSAKFLGNVELPKAGSDQRSETTIWFHAVSVGEVNLLDPLLKLIAGQHPDWGIYITVGTVTGYELAKKKYLTATVSYGPLDFSWAVRRAIERIKPTMLVLVELELWPNLIGIVDQNSTVHQNNTAHQKKIPIAVINGRLSEKSFRGYTKLKFLVEPVLRKIDLIAAQNEEYAVRFKQLGADPSRVQVTGSIKFDGARTERNTTEINELRAWAGFEENDVVMVAGSTSEPEEEILFDAVKNLFSEFPNFKLVVVPRHPERFEHVANLIVEQSQPFKRRSDLITRSSSATGSASVDFTAINTGRTSDTQPIEKLREVPRIILVDQIGELGHWWGTATIGFVGGSLTQRGGQNMIEPAAFGVATSFGPNTWNFRDVVQMFLSNDSAVVVRDAREIEAFVRRCLTDSNFAKELGQRAKAVVQKQQGAVGETLKIMEKLLVNDQ